MAIKSGESDRCGYYYPWSSWGCRSDGEAWNGHYDGYDDDEWNQNTKQTLHIVDATKGGTESGGFWFFMKNYPILQFGRRISDDPTIFSLDIIVNGVSIGTFEGTNNRSTKETEIKVFCKKNCSCKAEVVE